MPRELREKLLPWAPSAGTSVAVVSVAALIRGVTMPDLDTQLMAMTVLWMGLLFLQCILGPMRRHSSRWLVQYGAMAAYYLPFPLAIYAVNTVRSSSETNLYHVQCCIMLFVFSCPIFPHIFSIGTCTLSENPFPGGLILWSFFYFFCLWSLITMKSKDGVDGIGFMGIHLSLLLWGILQILVPHIGSHVLKEMAHNTILVADYMEREAKSGSLSFDDTERSLLGGCKYPVDLRKDGQWITVNDLLQCGTPPNIFLSYTPPDIFLSYSFFKLLIRRYLQFDCAEEGDAKVRDFVLRKLLPDHKMAFTIVEVQLAFLQGYHFASYWTHLNMLGPTISLLGMQVERVSILTLFFWSTMSWSIWSVAPLLASQNAFARVACLVPMAIWWFEKEQFLATDWYTVCDALRSYRTGSVRNIPTRMNTWFRQPNWQNEIGQYSLIEDYDRRSAKKVLLTLAKAIILPEWSPSFIKHHPMEEDAVRLTESVRKLVALTLRDINGPPTNGTRSLQRNRDRTMDDLSWTCRQRTHTHTILIWHIATCYCDMSPPSSYWPGNLRLVEISTCYEVATALSRYCAYLVAFLPEFLPEQNLTTQKVFQDVLQEAKLKLLCTICENALQKAKGLLGLTRISVEEKRIKIRGLELPEEEDRMTTFEKGVRLGRQLEQLNTLLRWKVMAEFWAETILYVAPSDNAASHFEHIAKGGEFVTHLWALLSNAGILKRAREE